MTTTRVQRLVAAEPAAVYRALTDPVAVQVWMVPDDMTSEVHEFDAREGGNFRISLTYDDQDAAGKTTANTDTFHGRFTRLVRDSEVVQVIEFESDDPAMRGEMTVAYRLVAVDGGTQVIAVHENVPPGVPPEANELGWSMSMDKLAALVER
jgi:uncharacterized protein YndB with AHSA1/START domain